MSATVYFYQNDMLLRLTGLTDINGDAIEDATVELVSLLDCDDETPDGITLPLTLTHQSAGTYEATVDDELDVEPGDVYTGKIVATSASGRGTWFEEIVVRRRTA